MAVVFLNREFLRSMKLHLVTEDSTVGAVQKTHRVQLICSKKKKEEEKHNFFMKILVCLGIKLNFHIHAFALTDFFKDESVCMSSGYPAYCYPAMVNQCA